MSHPLTQLPLAEKVAQLLMIDFPGLTLDETSQQHFRQVPWGGVILFAKNVESREQTVELNQQINQTIAHQPLIAIDQEGGLVDRCRFSEMTLSPGAMALAATQDPKASYEAHKIQALELKDLGFNLNFAPCIDVNNNPLNPIIGARSFGEDPDLVGEYGAQAIRGLQENQVAATAKHFPGHGDTSFDSHLTLPIVRHPKERLEEIELKPFQDAIKAGVEAIMTAHIVYPAFSQSEDLPATFCPTILQQLLRDKMGFEGVIVTDSLAMQAIADHWGMAEATVRSVEAGADLILALGPFKDQLEAHQALLQAVESGRISEERIDQSLQRLQKLKETYPSTPQKQQSYLTEPHRKTMREIIARTITPYEKEQTFQAVSPEEKLLILMPDALPVTPLGEMQKSDSLAKFIQQVQPEQSCQELFYHPLGDLANWRELAAKAKEADRVLVALYSRSQLPDCTLEMLEHLQESGTELILVSLSSPYLYHQLQRSYPWFFSYNYTPLSLEALAKTLVGQLPPKGKLPVSLTAKG